MKKGPKQAVGTRVTAKVCGCLSGGAQLMPGQANPLGSKSQLLPQRSTTT